MAETTGMAVARIRPDLESRAYISHVACVTSAVGECVNVSFKLTNNKTGKPVVMNGAAKYEIAAVVLAHLPLVQPRRHANQDDKEWTKVVEEAERQRCKAEKRIQEISSKSHLSNAWDGWPHDVSAQAEAFRESLPSVARLFAMWDTPTKCEEWEQLAEDLADNCKYTMWVRGRLWYRFRKLRSVEDGSERERYLRALVLIRVHRFAVGKSAEWSAKATDERTWLDVCLFFSRNQTTQADKEERTGHSGNVQIITYGIDDVPSYEGFHSDDLESGYPSPAEESEEPKDPKITGQKIAGRAERKKLREAVEALEGSEREVISLLLEDELSHDSIAKRLGLDLSTFETIRSSAMGKLVQRLNG